MADCELCGAIKVSTRSVIMGRAEVQACKRCIEKLGLEEKKTALLSQIELQSHIWWYGGIGKGKDIMLRGEKDLLLIFLKELLMLVINADGISAN